MNTVTTPSSKAVKHKNVKALVQIDMDYHTKALINKLEAAIKNHEKLAQLDAEYEANLNKGGFTYLNPGRIIDDLLSDDTSHNAKAVEALKAILVVDRSYSPEFKSRLLEHIQPAAVPQLQKRQ